MVNPLVVYDMIAEVVGVSIEFVRLSAKDIMLTPEQVVIVTERVLFNSGAIVNTYGTDLRPIILSAVLKQMRVVEANYTHKSRKAKHVTPRVYAAIIMYENYGYLPKEICAFFEKDLNFFYKTVREYMGYVENDMIHISKFNKAKKFVIDNVKYN